MSNRHRVFAFSIVVLAFAWGLHVWVEYRRSEAQREALLLGTVLAASRGENVDDRLGQLAGVPAAPSVQRPAVDEAKRLQRWTDRLALDCATDTTPLIPHVRTLHRGVARIEDAVTRAEAPPGAPIESTVSVRGLPVLFGRGMRFCAAVPPDFKPPPSLLVPAGTFTPAAPGVWKLESTDGTATAALLSPDALPAPPAKLVAFAPVADFLVVALKADPLAVRQGLDVASEVPSWRTTRRCGSLAPLEYVKGGWRPWSTKSVDDTDELDGFAAAVRDCLTRSLREELLTLEELRAGGGDALPEYRVANVNVETVRVDLAEERPYLVLRNRRVAVDLREGGRSRLSWDAFGAIVGRRMQPFVLDGAAVEDVFVVPPGIPDADFPAND